LKVGDKNSLPYLIKWFFIPWLIFIIIGVYLYNTMKTPEKNLIKPFVNLTDVNPDELLILDQKRAISEGVERKENMPFYLEGTNGVGVLLIHGFTATPYEMRQLGEFLNEKGFSVYGARLPGHGSDPSYINKLTFVDMYESLKYGYFVLRNKNSKIIVLGQSMGGLLAGEVAVFNRVDGVIMLSPAFKIKSKKAVFVPVMRKFIDFSKKEDFNEKLEGYYYKVRPVEGIYQLMRLSNHLISLLSEIKSDVFVIQSNFDDIIDPKATEYFFRKIGTDRKTIEILNDNRVKHILTTDENPLKDEIFLKVYNWILGVI